MKYLIIILLLILTVCSGITLYFFIKLQKKKSIGQSIRGEGPKNHLIKSGTPTMGGLLIIFNIIAIYLVFKIILKPYISFDLLNAFMIFFPFVMFGLIGFIDDYLIMKKKTNEGIKPLYKFLLELFTSAIFYLVYLIIFNDNRLNFFGIYVDLGFMYGVLLLFMLSGFTNATNFTDGLDGLFGLNGIISFLFIGIYSYYLSNYHVLLVCLITIFVLISFLVFNLPKASLFMGDTGSLSIGALMISLLIILKAEVLIVFFGFIYLLEILSVILQVWYFKKTKGKRIFKMSPIHHHFELCGLTEIQINLLFCFINLIMSSIGLFIGVKVL